MLDSANGYCLHERHLNAEFVRVAMHGNDAERAKMHVGDCKDYRCAARKRIMGKGGPLSKQEAQSALDL